MRIDYQFQSPLVGQIKVTVRKNSLVVTLGAVDYPLNEQDAHRLGNLLNEAAVKAFDATDPTP